MRITPYRLSHPETPISFEASVQLIIQCGLKENQTVFIADSTAVCSRSAFFKNAIESPLYQQHRTVYLLEDEPPSVHFWLMHVMKGRLCTIHPTDMKILTQVMSPEEINKEYIDLCKLYSLCEKLDDRITREAIVIRMHKMARRATPPFDCVDIIYQGTMGESPMRKLLVDVLLRAGVDDDLNACRDSLTEEFMQYFTRARQRQMHFRMRKRKEYREREGAYRAFKN